MAIDLVSNATPWIVNDAKEYLDSKLRPGMKVCEWGVGGSTLYFLKAGCSVFSVEHNEKWFELVQGAVRHQFGLDAKWTCALITPPACPKPKIASLRMPGKEWYKYCEAIANEGRWGPFHIVLIDGRARNGCMARTAAHVKPGGLVILDNSDRKEYDEGIKEFAGWPRIQFTGPGPCGKSWQTTIWRK